MPRVRYEEILFGLDQALAYCESIGLANHVKKGRFGEYRRLMSRLVEAAQIHKWGAGIVPFPQEIVEQKAKYFAALHESLEFGDLLPYLHQCDTALVHAKLKVVLTGPLLPSDEIGTSNVARNIQFELFLASQLWQAGFKPQLGEWPDLQCEIDGILFLFECKRLLSMTETKLRQRIFEASKQIHKNPKRVRSGAVGVIAISLSRVLNPQNELLVISDEFHGRSGLKDWLIKKTTLISQDWGVLSAKKHAVAIFFHVSSPFLNLEFNAFQAGQYWVGHGLINENSPYHQAVRRLAESMKSMQY